MQELTWEKILISQQQDFIARVKYYIQEDCLESSGYPRVRDQYLLSKLIFLEDQYSYYNSHNNYYEVCCELIQIDSPYFTEYIHYFCLEMSDKYMNYYIGKLGEEAVKLYLGSLITEVDYELYEYGDGGVDFKLTKDKDIGIQVKTCSLLRISTQDIKNYGNIGGDVYLDFLCNFNYYIAKVKWQVKPDELNKNKVCIFVLLLSFVEGNEIDSKPELLMAGWKPSHMINNINCIRMEDLFYMGGIRSYLESL